MLYVRNQMQYHAIKHSSSPSISTNSVEISVNYVIKIQEREKKISIKLILVRFCSNCGNKDK